MNARELPPTLGKNDAPPAGFVLRSLHVFNWGPFGGLHHAEFDAWGSALIGATNWRSPSGQSVCQTGPLNNESS